VFSPDAKQVALKFRAVKTPHGRSVFCQTLSAINIRSHQNTGNACCFDGFSADEKQYSRKYTNMNCPTETPTSALLSNSK